MKKLFTSVILGYLAYLIFNTSCANPGMPTGGDKDTIAPVVLKTVPEFEARNYKGKTVALTFDEFVISTDVAQKLVVSPPIKKAPLVRTKSKTLIIDLRDQLKPNTTYSLDFKNAIADNNEKNPLENFRFAFSNGPTLDTLTIGGYVRKAENMEPVEEVVVMLHSIDSLSAFRDSVPNYIAKTDAEGFYQITNIAAGVYRLYALADGDNSYTFNAADELIAFYDSLVVPQPPVIPDSTLTAHMKAHSDTCTADHQHLSPGEAFSAEPFYLLLFRNPSYEQFLESSKRDRANLCTFLFSESLTDSFRIDLIKPTPTPDWAIFEYSHTRDSLNVWVKDTVLAAMDTLKFSLRYEVPDSSKNLVLKTDTIALFFKKPEVKERKKKKDEEKEQPKIQHFTFRGNGREGFDVYSKFVLEVPEPLARFDLGQVHLFQKVDTVMEPREFKIEPDPGNLRKYRITYPWVFQEEYSVEIDSAAALTIGGFPSNAFKQKLKIKEEGAYAKITLNISNIHGPCFVQLLKNSDKEEVLQQVPIEKPGVVEFPFLSPDKFKIRLVIDPNQNGQWDTGNIDEGRQPERVVYFPKILKMRANFQVDENWALPDDLQFKKELIDEEKDQKDKDKKKQGSRPTQQSSRQPRGPGR